MNLRIPTRRVNNILSSSQIQGFLIFSFTITVFFVIFVFQYSSETGFSDYFIKTSTSINSELPSSLRSATNDNKTSDSADIKAIPYELIERNYKQLIQNEYLDNIDWTKYAYASYSTSMEYLKSAIINSKRLRENDVKADIVILYVKEDDAGFEWKINQQNSLIESGTKNYGITFIPVNLLHFKSDEPWWEDGFTKFHVFGLTQYKRVIYFDADCLFYDKLDELFFSLPEAMIYAPVNYITFRDSHESIKVEGELVTPIQRETKIEKIYEKSLTGQNDIDLNKLYDNLPSIKSTLGVLLKNNKMFELVDHFFVLEPNQIMYQDFLDHCETKTGHEYDMDLFNKYINPFELVKNNVFKLDKNTSKPLLLVLPHNPYCLLSGEFKYFKESHECFLTDPQDLAFASFDYKSTKTPYWSYKNEIDQPGYGWNSTQVFSSAKSIHFSDYPITKPWIRRTSSLMKEMEGTLRDQCKEPEDGLYQESCTGVDTWFRIYNDYFSELKAIF